MISKYVLANIVTPLAYIRILRVIDLETSMPNYDKTYALQFKKKHMVGFIMGSNFLFFIL